MARSALLLVTTLLAACEYDVSGANPATDDSGAVVRADAGAELADGAPDVPDATLPTDPDARPPLTCPNGYTVDPTTGTSYRVGTFPLDWSSAEGACADDGSGTHLAVVGSAAELERVKMLSVGRPVWLGLTDIVTEHDFVTVTGESTSFAPWGFGEPNDGGLFGEDCVELLNGAYNDHGCGSFELYVCECDGRDEDPTAF